MYQRATSPHPASVYIPPSYRGNALYLERLGREEEAPCDEHEDSSDCRCEPPCECHTPSPSADSCRGDGIFGRILSFLGSDGAVVAAVVLFLLFSRKSKKEEQSDDMLTLLLLLLVLL